MLTHLELKIEMGGENLSYQSSYLFQGVLMESLNQDIGNILHSLPCNPYSQWLEIKGKSLSWHLFGLNEFAYENIIKPMMDIKTIHLENKELTLDVKDMSLTKKKRGEMIEEVLFGKNTRNIDLAFKTPTSFKRDERFVIFPDTRLIFQNLMRKFDAGSEETMFSFDLLDEMADQSYISSYKMRSAVFHMKQVRIPSFIGEARLRIEGRQEMVNLANLLLRFGEYSGLGIKTSIGMGGIEIRGDRNG